MEIALTPELEQLVHDKVKSGRYSSASDVVGEALRLLQERDDAQSLRLEELKQQIRVGIEDLNAGRAVAFDEETLKGIKQRGREKLANPGQTRSSDGSRTANSLRDNTRGP
jgi:antitoxin ParD1/3/4